MLANRLPDLLPLFSHEAKFAYFLKPAHGLGIVAGMFVTRPQAGGLVIVGFVHFQRKIVTNENELAEHLVIAHQPRAHNYARGEHTQSCSEELLATIGQSIQQPQQAEWKHAHHRGIAQRDYAPKRSE